MSLTLPERRKIAVLSGDRRTDVAVPLDDTLGEALRDLGYAIEPGRHVVLERNGAEARLATLGAELTDGELYAIIDLRGPVSTTDRRSGDAIADRREGGAIWWMLAMVAIVAVGVDLFDGASSGFATELPHALAIATLALAAVISALVWALRHPRDDAADALAMLAPVALAFAAGFVAVPLGIEAGVQLAVVSGLLAAGILAALFTVTVGGLRLRSASGTATVLVLGLAAIWGLTLLAGMDLAAAAAISAGAVPLGLRALPSTLVNVADGYHIDYAQFMSNRWTVRGSVPESPESVQLSVVREVVQDSSARLLSGTILLSSVAVTMTPLALAGSWDANPLVLGGSIGLLATLALALLLIPRHSSSPLLRWVPRAAAALVVLETTFAVAAGFGQLALSFAAAAFLVIGLIAAAVLVPISRGASSLVWSRLADVLEWLAIALCLPAGLLAADILTLMRGMMAA